MSRFAFGPVQVRVYFGSGPVWVCLYLGRFGIESGKFGPGLIEVCVFSIYLSRICHVSDIEVESGSVWVKSNQVPVTTGFPVSGVGSGLFGFGSLSGILFRVSGGSDWVISYQFSFVRSTRIQFTLILTDRFTF